MIARTADQPMPWTGLGAAETRALMEVSPLNFHDTPMGTSGTFDPHYVDSSVVDDADSDAQYLVVDDDDDDDDQ